VIIPVGFSPRSGLIFPSEVVATSRQEPRNFLASASVVDDWAKAEPISPIAIRTEAEIATIFVKIRIPTPRLFL
jgi:hypothetical protein